MPRVAAENQETMVARGKGNEATHPTIHPQNPWKPAHCLSLGFNQRQENTSCTLLCLLTLSFYLSLLQY